MIMSHNQKGLSLLEIVIGMAISTILASLTFTIYNQISRSSITVNRQISTDTKAMILQNRLQKDLTGITPLWFGKEEKQAAKSAKSNTEQQKANKKEKKKFLVSKNNNDKTLQNLTFITVNPLQVYGTTQSRLKRIVYILEKDPQSKKIFTLKRKEIDDITAPLDDEKIINEGKAYEIASNITQCSIKYEYFNQPQQSSAQPKQETSQKKSNKPIELISSNDWNSSDKQEQEGDYKPALPDFATMSLTFQQDNNQTEEYELYFIIPVNANNKISSFSDKKQEQSTNEANQQPTGNRG